MTDVRHDPRRASVLRHWLACALVVSSAAAAPAEQSREDAWWTGPMLAPSAATLPQGHVLVEPYLFDVMTDGHFDMHGTRRASAHEHDIGSLSYILYGLTERLSVGLIPRFGFNEPAGAPNSSSVGAGDVSLQAGYGLTRFEDGRLMPAISLVIDETLPTGRYQRLARVSDVRADSGSGYSLALAPAIEYNFNSRVGLLVGVRMFVAGRNTTSSVTPAIALNMVY